MLWLARIPWVSHNTRLAHLTMVSSLNLGSLHRIGCLKEYGSLPYNGLQFTLGSLFSDGLFHLNGSLLYFGKLVCLGFHLLRRRPTIFFGGDIGAVAILADDKRIARGETFHRPPANPEMLEKNFDHSAHCRSMSA